MGSIVPRSGGGGIERHGGRAGDDATGKAISYEHGGPVGWHRIPKRVREGIEREAARIAAGSHPIRAARAALSEPVAAGSGNAATRRKPDGSTYQSLRGWWCGSDLLVEVEVRRDLAARPDGRYEPASDWVEHAVEWHRLVDVATKMRRYEVGEGAGGGGEADWTDDPLEAIPGSAAAMVRNGLRSSDCWLTTLRRTGQATETVVGYAVNGDKLAALKAERSGASREALSGAAWQVTVTRAALAAVAPGEPVKPALGGSTTRPRLGRALRALGR
jgi:hypothetical protein